MAEKIEIFKLDIDLDSAIQSASAFKTEADVLNAKLKDLKEAGDTGSETYARLKGQFDAVNKEYKTSQREVAKLTALEGKEIKTIDQARNALSVANSQWAKQAKLYGANSEQADKLAKQTAGLRNRLKELEKGVGDNTRNVGGYSEGFSEAINNTGVFGQAQQKVSNTLLIFQPIAKAVKSEISSISSNYRKARKVSVNFSGAQKAVAVSTNLTSAALRILKVALISTGIGAIVVLLGSLVAWFSKTQTGIDLVNKVLAGLSAGFDVIIDRVAKFGGALIKMLSGDWKGGLSDMKDSFSGIGDEIQREVNLALELERVLQRVEKAEINLDIRRAAANSRLKELKLLTDDTTKSTKERIEAGKEFAKLEQSLTAEEVANQEKRVAAMLGYAEVTDDVREKIRKIGQEGVSLDQLGLSESTVDDMKEFRDEATKLFDLQAQSYERQTENQNKLNTLVDQQRKKEQQAAKERLEAAKRATDEAIKESEIRLKIFIEENQGKADTLEKGLSFQKKIRDERLEILKQELQAGNKTQAEYELEELEIKNEFLEKQKELTVQYANEELQIYIENHQSRIQSGELLTQQLVDQEKTRLDLIAQKQREYQEKRLEEGKISERDYNAAINQINEENRQAKAEQQQELKEQEAEAKAIDLENQRALDEERLNYDLQLNLQYLNQEKEKELEIARQKGADTTKIEAKFAEQKKQIEATVQENKTALASQTFGNLATILGKESKAGKAAAVAQTTIDTYQSATAAYKALAGIPVVGPALGAVAAGAAVASGLANVRKIVSTKNPKVPKAEKGALFKIGGKRHYAGGTRFRGEDGTEFEAEKDELIGVMNRRAAMAFSAFNDEYAGGSTVDRANYLANGGFVQTRNITEGFQNFQTQSPIDYATMAKAIGSEVANANRNLPRPVTDVKDVIDQVNEFNTVVDGANI